MVKELSQVIHRVLNLYFSREIFQKDFQNDQKITNGYHLIEKFKLDKRNRNNERNRKKSRENKQNPQRNQRKKSEKSTKNEQKSKK